MFRMFVIVSSSEGKEGQLTFCVSWFVFFFNHQTQYQETIHSTRGLTERQQ